jgi:hypothetical protein
MSTYPPVWGSAFWNLLHTTAYQVTTDQLDLVEVRTFVRTICAILPCPACVSHCRAHLDANPLELQVTSAASYWDYLVRLHNTVNARCDKLSISNRAARHGVRERLAYAGAPTLASHFDYGHWVVLATACQSDPPLHDAALHQFIRSWCNLVPFGQHPADDRSVCDVLLSVHIDSRDSHHALESVERMYNSVSRYFDHPHLAPRQLARDVSTLEPRSVLRCIVASDAARVEHHAHCRRQHLVARRLLYAAAGLTSLCTVLAICLGARRASPRTRTNSFQ